MLFLSPKMVRDDRVKLLALDTQFFFDLERCLGRKNYEIFVIDTQDGGSCVDGESLDMVKSRLALLITNKD